MGSPRSSQRAARPTAPTWAGRGQCWAKFWAACNACGRARATLNCITWITMLTILYYSIWGARLLYRSPCRPWPLLGVTESITTCLGVRPRSTMYSGIVQVQNTLDFPVALSWQSSDLTPAFSTELASVTLQPKESYSFDPGPSGNFDYRLVVRPSDTDTDIGAGSSKLRGSSEGHHAASTDSVANANVVRNGTYEVVAEPVFRIAEVSGPPRLHSSLLANTKPGLSFAFSASGWLMAYEFGAAHSLQNHGIAKNPSVRLVGSSGGALALWTMMYGCDMVALKDFMKESASKVHQEAWQSMNLRFFVLEAMKTVLRDCSFEHPNFKDGRVAIAMSEGSSSILPLGFFPGMIKSRRVQNFRESADIAIALLASSSIGISGLPFRWAANATPGGSDGEGSSPSSPSSPSSSPSSSASAASSSFVADGAFTDFLPVVDDHSVKLKPFSDGLNVVGPSQRGDAVPDVAPTEFVSPHYGIWPPDSATMDHLFEMGYRDMENWLAANLQDRLASVESESDAGGAGRASKGNGNSAPDAAQHASAVDAFQCDPSAGGMEWLEKVYKIVPVKWQDQIWQAAGGS